MIRILAFILCLFPVTAFGAVYQFEGDASCQSPQYVAERCSVFLSFEIDPEDFGKDIFVYETSNIRAYIEDETGEHTFLWGYVGTRHLVEEAEDCYFACAEASTDAAGILLSFSWICNDCDVYSSGSWIYKINRSFKFRQKDADGFPYVSGDLSLVPLPSGIYLFGAALLGLGALRRFKRT